MGDGAVRDAFRVTMTRDALGEELVRKLPGGVVARWTRDRLGRPVEHVVESGHVLERAVQYEWRSGDELSAVNDAARGMRPRR